MASTQERDIQKKLNDDRVFCLMNTLCISVREDETKRNNVILQKGIDALIARMKAQDTFFAKTFEKIVFGGSFYKGTKISSPREFDLDIIIKLPINYKTITFHPGPSSCIKIHVGNTVPCKQLTDREKKILEGFISQGFIDQNKFRAWAESVVNRAINSLPNHNGYRVLYGENNEERSNISYKKMRKSGPAYTVELSIPNDGYMSVDLVPALAFSQTLPSSCCQRSLHEFQNKTWFAVPKPISANVSKIWGSDYIHEPNLYWRLSFYQQEKEIFARNGRFKPVIRHIKKLRDTQNWTNIASYYIESLFLNEIGKIENLNTMSFTKFFYTMLKAFHVALTQHRIQYYWNSKCNLLEKMGDHEIVNIRNRLNNIIKNIERRITVDDLIIARYLLTAEELDELEHQMYYSHLNEYDNEFFYSDVAVVENEPVQAAAASSCSVL